MRQRVQIMIAYQTLFPLV